MECVKDQVERWLEQAVIGLNLCPFASKPHREGLVRIEVCMAPTPERALDAFFDALDALYEHEPSAISNTLLVFPRALEDFDDFLDMVARAERVLKRARARSFVQLASFHPHYRFEREDDPISALTNCSPYPILHLLRAAEVEHAIARHPDTLGIPAKNIETLHALPPERIAHIWPWFTPASDPTEAP